MLARLHLAPTGGNLLDALDQIADALVHVNLAWIMRLRDRKLDTPCCTSCAEPPWVARPVVYVPHHGAPTAPDRDYLDGPTMFARGRGTCIDIACYDAAAAIAKGKSAKVVLEGGPSEFHAVLYVDGVRTDPSAEIAAKQRELLRPSSSWSAAEWSAYLETAAPQRCGQCGGQ